MKLLNTNSLLIFLLIGFFILYSSVSLTSPIAFGDEGFYAAESRWIAENGIYPIYEPLRGTEVLHEKIVIPPLYSITQSFMWLIGGELGIKFLIPVFSILAAAMIYLFLKKFDKPKAGLVAAIAFLTTPSLVTYGILNYTDTLLCLLFICSAYFGYIAFKSKKMIYCILTGIFVGLTFLAKGSGFLIFAILVLYFLLSMKFKKIKNWKILITILIVFGVMISPWIIRSLILYNSICYHPILLQGCDPVLDKEIPKLEGLEFAGRIQETGTEASIWKIGLINYYNFAFGWTVLILFIFGTGSFLVKKPKMSVFLVSWLLIFIPIFLLSTTSEFFGSTGRAEDTARYTLPLVIPIAMIAGIFVEDIFKSLKKYGGVISIIFAILLLFSLLFYAQQKLDTMKNIKGFSAGFFEGCKWIKENTPKDSIFFSIYAHHTMYYCNRESISFLPDNAEIQLTNNDTAYEHLKLHGFDYVFIQDFTLSNTPYREAISTSFLNYLESSDKFEKVYDNTNIYGNSGVRLYKLL
ncbi:MAG: ArnT family glycosyltransferase [Candidatus Odinarchaeota archaeon]